MFEKFIKLLKINILFNFQAGKILLGTRDQLTSLYKNEKQSVKESLHKLFPRVSMMIDREFFKLKNNNFFYKSLIFQIVTNF